VIRSEKVKFQGAVTNFRGIERRKADPTGQPPPRHDHFTPNFFTQHQRQVFTMSGPTSEIPVLPNEVWLDILRHLSLDSLWYSTRPVCSLFYHVSTSIVKSALVEGSSCDLRHYISFKDPLLSESLHYPTQQTEYQRQILRQEGHSPFSQILLWSSITASPARPRHGPGIPTVNYESADGKKCVTMAVFGHQDRTSSSHNHAFHCRRTGCVVTERESASDGHVCLAGCWHVHYSRVNQTFCATIPLAILLPIYLRLESARRQITTARALALERKGRWNGASRHGVSASVSPVADVDDMMDNLFGGEQSGSQVDEGEDGLPGTLMEWSEDEDGYLNGLFDVYGGSDSMELDG
jgi:hypothetical protein